MDKAENATPAAQAAATPAPDATPISISDDAAGVLPVPVATEPKRSETVTLVDDASARVYNAARFIRQAIVNEAQNDGVPESIARLNELLRHLEKVEKELQTFVSSATSPGASVANRVVGFRYPNPPMTAGR